MRWCPLLAVLAVVATGCGGGGSDGSGSSGRGKQVFTQRCGNCHELAAAGTRGGIGPNLDEVKPDEGTVTKIVKNGRGGMPALGGQLSKDDIRAVAHYVADNAGR